MKRYGWAVALLLMTRILTAPYPVAAQCGSGQMDHSSMRSHGQMMQGSMGDGQIEGSGLMDPDKTDNFGYANPNATVSGQPAGTWVPAPSGQSNPGDQTPAGHDHNH